MKFVCWGENLPLKEARKLENFWTAEIRNNSNTKVMNCWLEHVDKGRADFWVHILE